MAGDPSHYLDLYGLPQDELFHKKINNYKKLLKNTVRILK